MALRGKKKADFLKRMAAGRRKAARARGGSSSRKKPARRKATTTRRKATTTRRKATTTRRKATTTRRAPVRRARRTPEGALSGMIRAAVPAVVGIVAAGTLARAIPAADTPLKKAGVTTLGALGLTLFSNFVARNIPLRAITPTAIKAVAGGMVIDSVFRGTTEFRGNLDRLPEAARRPGGLLAGRQKIAARKAPRAAPAGSGLALAASMSRHGR